MTYYLARSVSAVWSPDTSHVRFHTDYPDACWVSSLNLPFPFLREMRQIFHRWGEQFSRLKNVAESILSCLLPLSWSSYRDAGIETHHFQQVSGPDPTSSTRAFVSEVWEVAVCVAALDTPHLPCPIGPGFTTAEDVVS